VANREVLIPLLADMVKRKSRQEWIALLEDAGVPCGPINQLDDVFNDPQVKARGMQITLPHPTAGSVKLVGNPMKLSATPPDYQSPPPLLGQHTGSDFKICA
jgi:formyl-CoA transferase